MAPDWTFIAPSVPKLTAPFSAKTPPLTLSATGFVEALSIVGPVSVQCAGAELGEISIEHQPAGQGRTQSERIEHATVGAGGKAARETRPTAPVLEVCSVAPESIVTGPDAAPRRLSPPCTTSVPPLTDVPPVYVFEEARTTTPAPLTDSAAARRHRSGRP